MPTAAFIAAAENSTSAHWVWLAKIVLPAPTAATMRVASEACRTPDGALWEAGLVAAGPVRERGGLGVGMAPAASASITLADREYSPFPGFALRSFQGTTTLDRAAVTLYLWEASTTNAADVQQMFAGDVFESSWEAGAMTLTLAEDARFDREAPAETIEKKEYPGAAAWGMPKPIIMGDFSALNQRPPFSSPAAFLADSEDAGSGGGVVPGLLVDPSAAGGKAVVMYAGHECKELHDAAAGYNQFIKAGSRLAPLVAGGVAEVLSAPASVEIDEDGIVARTAIYCVDVNTTAGQNSALKPRNAMTLESSTFATLDEGAGATKLCLRIGSSPDMGSILSTEVVVCAIGDAGNAVGSLVRAYIYRPTVGDSSASATINAQLTVATVARVAVASTWDGWEADGGSVPRDLRVDFTGAGANRKASVLWVCLVVKYRPNQRIVAQDDPTVVGVGPRFDVGGRNVPRPQPPGVVVYQNRISQAGRATYELSGDFFANVQGMPDDGSGHFTGSAAALIQRAPDVARAMLETLGGVASADVETGAATFGSFIAARDAVRDGRPGDYHLSAYVGAKTSVRDLVTTAARNARSLIKRSPKSGKWQMHVERLGARPNFRRALSWRDGDLLNFEPFQTSRTQIAQAFRIGYRRDFFRNRPTLECFVGPAGSVQGWANQAIADQSPIISAGKNDALKWSTSAVGPFTDTLAAGSYTTSGLLAVARTAMRTHVANMQVGHGCLVVAGWNDILDLQVGASVYSLTMPAGYYAPDEWAWVAERLLNSVTASTSRVFAVTYSQATNKFTVSADGNVTLLASTGPNAATSAWPIAGFLADSASAASFVSPFARYSRAAWFASATGTAITIYGTNTATAAGLFGFEVGVISASAGGIAQIAAPLETGDRVLQAQAVETSFGSKPEAYVEAEFLRNQDAATALRNWMFDTSRRRRAGATFDLTRCPDVEVGHVLELDSSIDETWPCPGRSSWANLPLLVVECDYYPFPQWRSRVRVIDVASA